MTKKLKRAVSIFTAVIMLVLVMSPVMPYVQNSEAATTKITGAHKINLGGSPPSITESFKTSNGLVGTCMQPANQKIPEKGNSVTITELSRNNVLAKVAYLAYKAGSTYTSTKMYNYGRAAAILNGSWTINKVKPSRVDSINAIMKKAKSMDAVPGNFVAYKCNPTNGGQDFLGWKTIPNGKAYLMKKAAETTTASLAGATYSVKNSAGKTVGTLTTTASGKSNTLTLVPGKYTVKETYAPDGFGKDLKNYSITVSSGKTSVVNSTEPLDVKKPYLTITKKDAETGETVKIAGAKFKVKNTDTNEYVVADGESVFGTDDFGIAYVDPIEPGNYQVEEIEAPEGYSLATEPVPVTVTADGGNKVSVEVKDYKTPELKTTATDSKSGNHLGTIGSYEITDTVKYSHITKDVEYTLKGKLVNKDTGEPVLVNNKEVTAEKTFTPESSEGSVDVKFNFDSSSLRGLDVVCFEELYTNDSKIAEHTDVDDEDQSIHFPDIYTYARDKATNDSVGTQNKDTTIIDTASYENLLLQ